MMGNQKPIKKIILFGAGPSGLLLALLLAKQGIQIELLEANTELDSNPRAAHYAPSSIRELRRAGVLEDLRQEGFIARSVAWRQMDGSFIAGIQNDTTSPDAMTVLPLNLLLKLIYRHLQKEPTAEVKWSHRVVGIDQDENEARVEVETPEGRKTLAADYIIGSDGASSQIRRSLFGPKSFPGETLTSQIVATNVYYDFEKFGYGDAQFTIHPTDWYMAARITPDGMWRVTYGDIPGLSTEEYLKRQPMRYESILPGNPKPGDYKLVGASPYKLQQRCAKALRVGRFLLVADAAHLCNPFGGMGLTGGFADVTSLYDCLVAMQNGLADDTILDKYSEIRIKKWRELIDPISRANFNRLWTQGDEAEADRENFWKMCRATATDENIRKQGEEFTHLLNEDFTPYFTKQTNSASN